MAIVLILYDSLTSFAFTHKRLTKYATVIYVEEKKNQF